MFKVKNKNTITRCEIFSSVSIVNFEKVNADWDVTSQLAFTRSELTMETLRVSIVNFEQVYAAWEVT